MVTTKLKKSELDLETSHQPQLQIQGTKLTIRFDCGFNNQLYIRGSGANLNWNKGIPLKNIKHDEWEWVLDNRYPNCEFKILINDKQYEAGENHHLHRGHPFQHSPRF